MSEFRFVGRPFLVAILFRMAGDAPALQLKASSGQHARWSSTGQRPVFRHAAVIARKNEIRLKSTRRRYG